MTNKLLFALTLCLGLFTASRAQNLPEFTKGDEPVWFLIEFANGGAVVEAQNDGEEVKTATLKATDNQMWKFVGDNTTGFQLVSRSGKTLYATTTAKNGMLHAAATPANSNTTFVVQTTTNTTYADGLVLSPKANTAVYMNQWGGAGAGKSLGLWDDRSDENQPFRLVSEEDYLASLPKVSLIPYPQSLTIGEGFVNVASLTGIGCDDAAAMPYAEEFAARLKATGGINLPVGRQTVAGGINLTTDASLRHEAYTLQITSAGVDITAADSTGFFYALQTLKQLLPNAIYGQKPTDGTGWTLPMLDIADHPQWGHRGFMLDVARHFFSKTEVKRVLDVMATYKLNRLHWHLTDDQGWRVEIPEYPRLTEVGSIRQGSFVNAGGDSKFFDDTEYGRGKWFSLDDLREIVAYAKRRNIEIIPEIDLPGHMVAAVAAYPNLSCDSTKTYSVRIDGGISQDVLNVGRDEVIDFLKCVLGHIAEVFPYPYIHIGGDECPTTQWATNADCLKRVADEGLSGVEELQPWLVEQLGTWLKDTYGKDIVVWDELLTHWTASNTVKPVIMAWNNITKSADAADKGFKSIVVPYQSLYLDFYQVPASQRLIDEPYQGGWGDNFVNSIEDVYALNPVGSLSGREDYCLGVQGNLWTETCNDSIELEYQLLPRMLALSETGWLPASAKNWHSFHYRLQSHDEILDQMGYTYARHYIIDTPQTEVEKTLTEAQNIAAALKPGQAGYPTAEVASTLAQAIEALKADPTDAALLTALQEAITAVKTAPVVTPTPGKTYKMVSAATYYREQYEGSTLYADGTGVRFHYTPQTEPEELWTIEADGTGYKLKNIQTGLRLTLPTLNEAATLTAEGSQLTMATPTSLNGAAAYIPGTVVWSVAGDATAGSVRRLYAYCTGKAMAKDNASPHYPGTWRLEEVNDYAAWLQGLVTKAKHIILTARPGQMNEPTEEALAYLTAEVITPATDSLAQGTVTEATYLHFVERYNNFLAMPRTSPADALSEDVYYRIANAYFTTQYAKANTSTGTVVPATLNADDETYLWQVKKNTDGSICLYNVATRTAARVGASTADTQVKLGEPTAWTLSQNTTDEGQTGLNILAQGGETSWYVNPNAWNYVLLKPKTWGAAIWTFEKTSVVSGIGDNLTAAIPTSAVTYYDLQGRRLSQPTRGVCISSDGHKTVRP